MDNLSAEQAFGILAAAHAEAVVTNRVMVAEIAQLRAQLAALTPPGGGEQNVVPIKAAE